MQFIVASLVLKLHFWTKRGDRWAYPGYFDSILAVHILAARNLAAEIRENERKESIGKLVKDRSDRACPERSRRECPTHTSCVV